MVFIQRRELKGSRYIYLHKSVRIGQRIYKVSKFLGPEEDFSKSKVDEEMNLKYKEIRKTLRKGDWTDIKKRFVANFIFESNALEGNSLTLKNFSEIVFENKIVGTTDLREVYDAKNSYEVFSKLFTSKREITEEFILDLHKRIMKNIDDRNGYKKLPNILLGRNLQLTEPKKVPLEMRKLLT